MKASEIIKQVKSLIETPFTHCKDSYALNTLGIPIDEDSPDAVKWCARGAFQHIFLKGNKDDDEFCREYGKAIGYVTGEVDERFRGLIHFNDASTHEEVMDLFDRAIKIAESEEQCLSSQMKHNPPRRSLYSPPPDVAVVVSTKQ